MYHVRRFNWTTVEVIPYQPPPPPPNNLHFLNLWNYFVNIRVFFICLFIYLLLLFIVFSEHYILSLNWNDVVWLIIRHRSVIQIGVISFWIMLCYLFLNNIINRWNMLIV